LKHQKVKFLVVSNTKGYPKAGLLDLLAGFQRWGLGKEKGEERQGKRAEGTNLLCNCELDVWERDKMKEGNWAKRKWRVHPLQNDGLDSPIGLYKQMRG